jgi:outer membrane receptor protein involved in Fe transport
VLTHIPTYSYLDLSAEWIASSHVQLYFTVNNVFDKDPRLVPLEVSHSAGDLNTFPTYDVLGRTILLAVRATF